MEQAFSIEAWMSPVGIGFFLVSIALTIYLLSLTDSNEKKKR